MSECFTTPKDWNCFEILCSKYPRNIGKSKIFRLTVEEQLRVKNKKSNQTIEDFADKYPIDLESDIKLWKTTIKAMSTEEVRELHKLLKKREGLVGDELYKRTL